FMLHLRPCLLLLRSNHMRLSRPLILYRRFSLLALWRRLWSQHLWLLRMANSAFLCGLNLHLLPLRLHLLLTRSGTLLLRRDHLLSRRFFLRLLLLLKIGALSLLLLHLLAHALALRLCARQWLRARLRRLLLPQFDQLLTGV